MNLIVDAVEKIKEEEEIDVEVEFGIRTCNEKKRILESIKKIKNSGDEDKLNYVNNLYRFYSIFLNLNHLVNSHPILYEKELKYHCNTFYNFLNDKIVDTSKRVITGIITAIANDEPLESFYKYLMRPDIFEAEYRLDEEKYNNTSEEENDNMTEEENNNLFPHNCSRKEFYIFENYIQDQNRKKIHCYLEKLEKNGNDYKIRNIKKLYRIYNFFYEIKSLLYDTDTFVYRDNSYYSVDEFYDFLIRVVDSIKSDIITFIDMLQHDNFNNKKLLSRRSNLYKQTFNIYLK